MCAWEPVPQCGRKWAASSLIWPHRQEEVSRRCRTVLQGSCRGTDRQHSRQWFRPSKCRFHFGFGLVSQFPEQPNRQRVVDHPRKAEYGQAQLRAQQVVRQFWALIDHWGVHPAARSVPPSFLDTAPGQIG